MERQQYIKAVEKYGNTVYRVAYQYCGNRSDAEDIVQNVFLKLWIGRERTSCLGSTQYKTLISITVDRK